MKVKNHFFVLYKQLATKKYSFRDSFLIAIFFLVNIFLHTQFIGKFIYTFTDEGVYLYSAKLIAQGYIPYKDFFLAHPPFFFVVIGLILQFLHFNIDAFRVIFVIWFFTSLIPLYYITYFLTKSRIAAIIALLLFSTFAEAVQWDAHFFALRQASIPLLAFALYFSLVHYKPKIAGMLFVFFSCILISNIFITISFLITLFIYQLTKNKGHLQLTLYQLSPLLLSYTLLIAIAYGVLFFIPKSIDNIFLYQLNRPLTEMSTRIVWIKEMLSVNWPILLLGLFGSFILNQRFKYFGFFNILGFLFILLAGKSFYPHYLSILSIGLSISSGIVVSFLARKNVLKIIVLIIIIIILYKTNYRYLRYHLTQAQTLEVITVINKISKLPSPLFTFEPIYALQSSTDLTFHYYAADMRSLRVSKVNLSLSQYLHIINGSNSILLEPFAYRYIPQEALVHIYEDFDLYYSDNLHQLYVRKSD